MHLDYNNRLPILYFDSLSLDVYWSEMLTWWLPGCNGYKTVNSWYLEQIV